MVIIRTMREVSGTFEDLAFKIVKSLPTGYRRVDIVADSYLENSIKSSVKSKKILVKSSNRTFNGRETIFTEVGVPTN